MPQRHDAAHFTQTSNKCQHLPAEITPPDRHRFRTARSTGSGHRADTVPHSTGIAHRPSGYLLISTFIKKTYRPLRTPSVHRHGWLDDRAPASLREKRVEAESNSTLERIPGRWMHVIRVAGARVRFAHEKGPEDTGFPYLPASHFADSAPVGLPRRAAPQSP